MTEEELAELQKMVAVAAEEIENRLASKLEQLTEGIYSKVTQDVETTIEDKTGKTKVVLEALPHLIQEHVESQLKANLTGIVEEVSKQFEGKVNAMAGDDSAGGGGLSLDHLLKNSDKIIGVVNAFRQPTTEQAMMAQMNFVMKWHSLLSKLEKGGGSGDEVAKAIASTFATEKQA